MFSGPSDFFLTHGYSHRCICGAVWYDSDGGPCHWECPDCGKRVDGDDCDDDGYCWDCHKEPCPGCGTEYAESYLKEQEGFCEDCAYDLNLLKQWPEDEYVLHLDEIEKFVCKQAIEQVSKVIKKV